MKKTGELLRKAREDKRLSLHEIGLALKINSKILKAIEENDAPNLPAKTFLRGFVQSYAAYLKINSEEVMSLFAQEVGSTKPSSQRADIKNQASASSDIDVSPQNKNASPEETPLVQQSKEFDPKPIVYGAVILVLVGLIFAVKKVVDRYQKEAEIAESPALPEALPIADNPPVEKNSVPSTQAKPQAAPPSQDKGELIAADVRKETPPPEGPPTKPEVTPTPEPPSSSPSPSQGPSEPIPPVSDNAPSPSVPLDPKKPEEAVKPEAILPSAPAANSGTPITRASEELKEDKPKTVELIVEAMDPIEIEYSSLTGKIGKLKLNPDQVHTFKSSNGLKLLISNGGAANLILNGKDIGIPGEFGKPVRLTY